MIEFTERLKTLGDPNSDIRESGITAAEIIDGLLASSQAAIAMAQSNLLSKFYEQIELETKKGSSLFALKEWVENHPLRHPLI